MENETEAPFPLHVSNTKAIDVSNLDSSDTIDLIKFMTKGELVNEIPFGRPGIMQENMDTSQDETHFYTVSWTEIVDPA